MTKLKKFQKLGVNQIWRFKGRVLLGDEMGLGKTLQALTYAKLKPSCRPIIVVCPAFLKGHWEQEARHHINMRSQVLYGRRVVPVWSHSRCPMIIINFDILPYWVPYLKKLKPKMVIIDEVQFVKTRPSKSEKARRGIRTKAVQMLCDGVDKVICIGGTAGMENRPEELFVPLNILRPDLFPSFWRFGARYCKPRRRPWGWEYKGASNLPELHKILKDNLMIRRLKKDVMKELPEELHQVIPIKLPKPQEYQAAEHDFKAWIRKQLKSKKKLRKAEKAEALVKLGYLKRLAATLKLPSVTDWIDNFLDQTKEKIILFTWHKSVMKELREKYHKICVTIDGDTPKTARRDNVDKFNLSPKCRMIIVQVIAGGYGWSAKNCSTSMFVEIPWTPGQIAQAAARTHGIGRGVKGKRSTNYYMVAQGTIEERLLELLQTKQKILSKTLDGKNITKVFDVVNQLLKGYAHGKAA